MKLKTFYFLLTMIIYSGCATTKGFSTMMNSWTGQNINAFVDRNGYPQKTFKAPNGNTVYVYGEAYSYTTPQYTNSQYNAYGNTLYGTSTTYGGGTRTNSCTTWIEINNQNIIVKWRAEGNICKL